MDKTFVIQTAIGLVNQYPWFALIGAIISSASAIAAVTPTPKQGTVLSKAYKIIDILALNIGKAKQTGK